MTEGQDRIVPSSINDITPDGAILDQLTAAQIATVLDGFLDIILAKKNRY